jgi:hypothetical protein
VISWYFHPMLLTHPPSSLPFHPPLNQMEGETHLNWWVIQDRPAAEPGIIYVARTRRCSTTAGQTQTHKNTKHTPYCRALQLHQQGGDTGGQPKLRCRQSVQPPCEVQAAVTAHSSRFQGPSAERKMGAYRACRRRAVHMNGVCGRLGGKLYYPNSRHLAGAAPGTT